MSSLRNFFGYGRIYVFSQRHTDTLVDTFRSLFMTCHSLRAYKDRRSLGLGVHIACAPVSSHAVWCTLDFVSCVKVYALQPNPFRLRSCIVYPCIYCFTMGHAGAHAVHRLMLCLRSHLMDGTDALCMLASVGMNGAMGVHWLQWCPHRLHQWYS